MATIDQLFKREFKEMVRYRNMYAQKIKLQDIPLLDKEIKYDMKKLVYIKNIEVDYYNKLNNTYGFIVNKREMGKRQVLSDGSFRKDKNGNYIYDIIKVPQESIIVASTVNIKLKTGVKEEGFCYIDFIERSGMRYYFYILPRKNVFKTNVLALVVSNTRRKIFYKGYKLVCQDGVERYLYLIPFKNINYTDTKVVRVFFGSRALDDAIGYMGMYIRFLEHTNIIFNIDNSFLDDGENLTIKEYDGIIDLYDFISESFELKVDGEGDFVYE